MISCRVYVLLPSQNLFLPVIGLMAPERFPEEPAPTFRPVDAPFDELF